MEFDTHSTEKQVLVALKQIEADENVRVLYACESGSRAWGFESQDSDYDVRFLYIRPPDWYLSICKKRDVIERPIDNDLDISGWDFPKALSLFQKSNPPLLEWLQSPIVYLEQGSAGERLRKLIPDYYSPISCMYHYLRMAQSNYRQYLQGEMVWIKKYFYVLRPLLGCLWIEKDSGPVPTEFMVMVEELITDSELKNSIYQLVARKKSGHELDRGTSIPEISGFIEHQLSCLVAKNQAPAKIKDPAQLDELFVQLLIENYGKVLRASVSDIPAS